VIVLTAFLFRAKFQFVVAIALNLFWGIISIYWALLHHENQPGTWAVPAIYVGWALIIWVVAIWPDGERDG
jgi:hypothetical protein